MTITLTGEDLTIEGVVACAEDFAEVAIDADARERVRRNRELLDERIEAGDRLYGINTGLGALADIDLPEDAIPELQYNQIVSHAYGVGEPVDETTARAVMVVRLNSLLNGNSGIRPAIAELLCDLLNDRVWPHMPRKGSAGASGDLAPLSHLALVMLGEGKAKVADGDDWRPTEEILEGVGLEPVTFQGKEGVAVINSTSYMAGIGALAVHRGETLVNAADTIGTMSLEGLRGIQDAYHPGLHELRGQPGQIESAQRIWENLQSSELSRSSKEAPTVQDSYSLRCIAQVHGASRDLIGYARDAIEREINAVTDNPVILDSGEVVSGGNFHGQPVAFTLDMLACAIAEVASISERRIFKLTAGEEGLPSFLVEGQTPGVNSGFMIPQVTAASLVSENKTLTHPASTDSVPTADNQEDHVSMGANGANQLREVLENVHDVLAIELYSAFQALSFREEDPSDRTKEVLALIDEEVEPLEDDRLMIEDHPFFRELIDAGHLA